MFQDGYWRNQYHFSARPTILAWPAWNQAEYISWTDRPGQIFQNSAWPGRPPGARPGR
jgi:hypothetical protein